VQPTLPQSALKEKGAAGAEKMQEDLSEEEGEAGTRLHAEVVVLLTTLMNWKPHDGQDHRKNSAFWCQFHS
jgi:hypothetical protein